MEVVDCSSGILIPYYDHDTKIVFVAGKVLDLSFAFAEPDLILTESFLFQRAMAISDTTR